MRHWIGTSLQRRLNLALTMVLMLVSAAFLGIVTVLYRHEIAREHTRASTQINQLLQAALENAMLKRDLPGLHNILLDLGQQRDIVAVRILNPQLEVRFASDPDLENTTLDTPETRDALDRRKMVSLLIPDMAVLRSINPVPNQTACQTCHGPMAGHPVNGLLVVDYRASGISGETLRGVAFLALAGLAVILASLAAVWAVVSHNVLRPLRNLQTATAELAEGHLGYRIDSSGGDEMADLGRSFNIMAERVQNSVMQSNASEQALQTVIDAIPDGIRVIDGNFRIVKANAAYARHVGKPLSQVIGSRCYQSSHGRDTPCPDTLVCCPLAEMKADRAALTCRQTHRGALGEALHVEVAAAPVDLKADGRNIACVVEAIRDLEQQARLSQEQRLSELGLLAAGIAHEIHNPLSSVELVLSVLRDDLASGQFDRISERLGIIQTEVGRTLSITDSLLMLCMPPSPEALLIELDRVIPEALLILGFQARQSGVAIRHDVAPGLRVLGSDSDIRMMLTNLVLNAIHAMPQGGTIDVTALAGGADTLIRIEDTGHGIPPRDLDRIFLPFWTSRADGSSGRGLGLSIVKAIVDRAKGSVSVQSTVGKGTVFTIRMPNPDAPRDAQPI